MSSADAWQTRYFRIATANPKDAADNAQDPRSSAYLSLMKVPAERVIDAFRNRFIDDVGSAAPAEAATPDTSAESARHG